MLSEARWSKNMCLKVIFFSKISWRKILRTFLSSFLFGIFPGCVPYPQERGTDEIFHMDGRFHPYPLPPWKNVILPHFGFWILLNFPFHSKGSSFILHILLFIIIYKTVLDFFLLIVDFLVDSINFSWLF